MHKNATKCKKTQRKWCINKHGASKIIDTFETYQILPQTPNPGGEHCRGVGDWEEAAGGDPSSGLIRLKRIYNF
jgi:hypothetical protein